MEKLKFTTEDFKSKAFPIAFLLAIPIEDAVKLAQAKFDAWLVSKEIESVESEEHEG